MYDAIVVGARVAGASTAMLLARRGLKVLAVDRARFPSDTLSTHQVQVPGVARLARWGVLERIDAAGTPATRRVRFDSGPVVLEGHWPALEGVDALYSPRRTLLDARARRRRARGGRGGARGLRGRRDPVRRRPRRRHPRRAKAVARAARPRRWSSAPTGATRWWPRRSARPAYHVHPALSVAYYTYWAGVPMQGGEMYGRERRMIGAWPTNDGLVMTYVAAPADEFGAFRADPEGSLLRSLDAAGDLGERVRAGERAERVYGTADTANRFHVPHGPGWALVGDAGLRMDPITGQGIADAFRDAELLADAVVAGERRSAGYQARRDAAALPMYEMTLDLASFAPACGSSSNCCSQALAGPAGGGRPLPRRPLRCGADARVLRAAQPPAAARPARDAESRARKEEDGGMSDDAALVRAAQAGDPAALGELLERHRALLHAVAVGMLGHGPQAEDAVHDTFLIALRRIGDLRDPARRARWLLAILGNVCRAQLRRPARAGADDPAARRRRRSRTRSSAWRCATGCGRRSSGSRRRCGSRSSCATSRRELLRGDRRPLRRAGRHRAQPAQRRRAPSSRDALLETAAERPPGRGRTSSARRRHRRRDGGVRAHRRSRAAARRLAPDLRFRAVRRRRAPRPRSLRRAARARVRGRGHRPAC